MAYRLYETERTIDTNLIAQKTPVLIEGDTKTILTLKNVYMQYSGNTPFIFGNKQFDISNKLNVLKTDAPYLTPKPYRGKQNETGYVRYVAEAIADLRGSSVEEVAKHTFENTMRAYGIRK